MRDQMSALAVVLQGLTAPSEVSETLANKILAKVDRLQAVYLRVLECPAGKIMDCLLQLCGQTYAKLNHVLTKAEVMPWFTKVLKNDIACM